MLVGSDWYNNKLCDAIGAKRGDTVGLTCKITRFCLAPLTARNRPFSIQKTGGFRACAARENPCCTMRQQTSPLPLGKTLGQTGLTLGRIRVSAQCLLARQYHYGGGRTDQCEPAIQVPQRGEAGEVTLPRPQTFQHVPLSCAIVLS